VNVFNECVHEVFSAAGDIIIKSMMGGYLVYLNGKLIGDKSVKESAVVVRYTLRLVYP
jgi:TfoX/Sxy family transcriptional regulator of competence genes